MRSSDDRIDTSITFQPVNIAVMTVSDTRRSEDDRSGDLLASRINDDGHVLAARAIVTDDQPKIIARLAEWIDDLAIDVVVATGGTGLTGRDVTPEAFRAVFDKEIEGFGELFRHLSFQKIGTSTLQSRALAGVAGAHICLPCRGRHQDAVTAGMISFAINLIFVTSPVILLRLCLD